MLQTTIIKIVCKFQNESAIISDLDSFHGTQVNSEIINSEEQLTNGDLITVGNFDHTLE